MENDNATPLRIEKDKVIKRHVGKLPTTDIATLAGLVTETIKQAGELATVEYVNREAAARQAADELKQDTIGDLATIRSGAAKGATAYQKPGTGIPKTDMAADVQTTLGKADSAYQKPTGGIPKGDLSQAVQTALDKAGTALQQQDIATLTAKVAELDALVGIDTDGAINKFNEIVRFLSGIADTQTMAGIVSGINNQIAAKYTKPSAGIPKGDLSEEVRASLGKADTALQAHQDIRGKADKADTVSDVDYDTTGKKLRKTKNGATTDIVTARKIVEDGGGLTSHQTVTSDDAVLAFGQQKRIAKIGDTEIKVTMPSAPSGGSGGTSYDDSAILQRMQTAEGKITTLETKVSGQNGLETQVGDLDAALETLEDTVTDNATKASDKVKAVRDVRLVLVEDGTVKLLANGSWGNVIGNALPIEGASVGNDTVNYERFIVKSQSDQDSPEINVLTLPSPADYVGTTIELFVTPLDHVDSGMAIVPVRIATVSGKEVVRLDNWDEDTDFLTLEAGMKLRLHAIDRSSWVAIERLKLNPDQVAWSVPGDTSLFDNDTVPSNATLQYKVGLASDLHLDSTESVVDVATDDNTTEGYAEGTGNVSTSAQSYKDIENALTYFKGKNVAFVGSCGDVGHNNKADYCDQAHNNVGADNTNPFVKSDGTNLLDASGNQYYHKLYESPQSGFAKLYRDILYSGNTHIRFHTCLGNHDNNNIMNANVKYGSAAGTSNPRNFAAVKALRFQFKRDDYLETCENDLGWLSSYYRFKAGFPSADANATSESAYLLEGDNIAIEEGGGYVRSGSSGNYTYAAGENGKYNDANGSSSISSEFGKFSYFFTQGSDIFVFLSPFYGQDKSRANASVADDVESFINPMNLLDYTGYNASTDYGPAYTSHLPKRYSFIVRQEVEKANIGYDYSKEGGYDYQMFRSSDLLGLEKLLEANPNKRVFIFTHYFFPNLSGNGNQSKAGQTGDAGYRYSAGNIRRNYRSRAMGGVQFWFLEMLRRKYPKTVWFSGHSHLQWEDAKTWEDPYLNFANGIFPIKTASGNYDNTGEDKLVYTRTSNTPTGSGGMAVHLPSLSRVAKIFNFNNNEVYYLTNKASQGAVMEVYDTGIAIREIVFKRQGENSYVNFEAGLKWIPMT